MSLDKAEFGAFVAENRKKLGLTQKELAEKLHVTDKAVSKWERGLSYPDVTLLEPLAEVFGMGVTELVACGRSQVSPAPADLADWEIPPREVEKPEETAVQALLNISEEGLRTERRRLQRTAGLLLASGILLLGALLALALLLGRSTVAKKGTVMLVHAEWQGGDRCVFLDQGGHLLQLRCGKDVNWSLVSAIRGPWEAEYRYDRRTLRGELLRCELAVAVDRPAEKAEFSDDLSAADGGGLFGYPRVMAKLISRQPNPYGEGFLSSYVFCRGNEEDEYWFLHDGEELLRAVNCLGCGPYEDDGTRSLDYDGDGVRELLIRTVWPEKPCIVYDLEDGKLTETWLDEMPEEMTGPVE